MEAQSESTVGTQAERGQDPLQLLANNTKAYVESIGGRFTYTQESDGTSTTFEVTMPRDPELGGAARVTGGFQTA